MSILLKMNFKEWRAQVIATYMEGCHYQGAVCFSCGNASAALRRYVTDLIEVAPGGMLETKEWWLPEEIQRCWPTRFDATPGHLPLPLMVRLAEKYRENLGDLPFIEYSVPTGSGETIFALRLAYPHLRFKAQYNKSSPSTKWHGRAPLNKLVMALFEAEWL